MEFKKNKYDYYREYNKSQAAEELAKDFRIQSVALTKNKMVVITKPIIPTNAEFPKLILCPIGRYKIEIKNRMFKVDIKRIGGEINDGWDSAHINHNSDGTLHMLCWGNAKYEIENIKENLDWYWLVIKSLDLINNFKDDQEDDEQILALTYLAQVKFNPKIKTKLNKKVLDYIKKNISLKKLWKSKYDYSSVIELTKSLGLQKQMEKFDKEHKQEYGW